MFFVNSEPARTECTSIRSGGETKGKYIAILNSDDIFELNKLEECRKYLSEGNDFVFGKLKVIDENNKPMGEKDERVIWINQRLNNSNKPDTLEKLLQNINYLVTTSNYAFTRGALEKVGFFHEKLHIAHDFDYLIRIFEKELKMKLLKVISKLQKVFRN